MPSFKVKPEPPLSAEHARHYERFTGLPYDPEQIARQKSWAAFKYWHHLQMQTRDAAKLRGSANRRQKSGQGG